MSITKRNIDEQFLNLQSKILKNLGMQENIISHINKFSVKNKVFQEDTFKNVTNELDARAAILENVKDIGNELREFLSTSKRGKKIWKEIEPTFSNLNESITESNNIIKKMGNYIDDTVDKIPFLSEQMKKSLADTLKNAAAPLIDRLSSLGTVALDSFTKFSLFAKASIIGIIGLIVTAIAIFKEWDQAINKFHDELGTSRSDILKLNKDALTVYGTLSKYGTTMDDLSDISISLAHNIGNIKDVTKELIFDTSALQKSFGLSADIAAQFVVYQEKSLGLTRQQTRSNIKFIKGLADAYSVGPGKIIQDITENVEDAALFSKGMGENIVEAAVFARRLGVSLSDVVKLAENLLDIETSTQTAMEAQVLLGVNINLANARRMALYGNIKDANANILKQLSDQVDLNNLNYYSTKSIGDLLGVSADKAVQMVREYKKQEKSLNNMSATMRDVMKSTQETSFVDALKLDDTMDLLSQIWALLKNILNVIIIPISKYIIGPILWGIKSALESIVYFANYIGDAFNNMKKLNKSFATTRLLIGDMFTWISVPLKSIGLDMQKIPEEIKQIGKLLLGGGIIIGLFKIRKIFSGILGLLGKLTGKIGKIFGLSGKIGKGGGIFGKLFGSVNPTKILAGAAAIAIISGSLWVVSKAMQEFSTGVNWKGVLIGITSLGLLVGAIMVLGTIMSSGVGTVAILAGAAAIAIISGALWVAGKASQEFAKSANMMIPFFQEIGQMDPGQIVKMAGAITAISTALIALTGSSLIAKIGSLFGGNGIFNQLIELAKVQSSLGMVATSISSINLINKDFSLQNIKSEFESLIKPLDDITEKATKANQEFSKLAGVSVKTNIASAINGLTNLITGNSNKSNPPLIIKSSDVYLDKQKVGKIIFNTMQGE